MEKIIEIPTIPVIGIVLLLSAGINCHVAMANKKTYIVHMDHSLKPANFDLHTTWYEASLKSVSRSGQMLYIYEHAIQGFSVPLTKDEADQMTNQPGVIGVLPDVKYELHTTRTPSFMGMPQEYDILPVENVSQVVIGVLDTGVRPESPSFSDESLKRFPIPNSWRGICEIGLDFNSSSCNNKLIGARFFAKGHDQEVYGGITEKYKELRSPRDVDGHGTHTSTTAGGSAVGGANLLNYAKGMARGMAANARIATYKVCWETGCFGSDILSAIDTAIHDGVNVLSVSLGGPQSKYFNDSVNVGAFTAMEKGILISCSAGNSGPTQSSVTNVAPWILTVGAGTLDRDFPAVVSLRNGKNYSGTSLYGGEPLKADELFPFVYAGNVSNNGSALCLPDTLILEKVNGTIVLCDRGINARVEKGAVVKDAGGLGMVLANTHENGEELVADAFLLPAMAVGEKIGNEIRKYLSLDPKPMATIHFEGTKLGIEPSPVVAAFSSRGPNSIIPNILKPDLIGPGVNILAGWTDKVGPTGLPEDGRNVNFNIMSGTSMSCPHVSGLAALLKAAHPDWSPAAIRSALMTTAYMTYKNKKPILDAFSSNASTPFALGAGHVHPLAAFKPGLVYDLNKQDYLNFLCALKYTTYQVQLVARQHNLTCSPNKAYSVNDLNYPSFAVPLKAKTGRATYKRTLTNVESCGSTYKFSIYPPQDRSVHISVDTQRLTFNKKNEKKSYTVTFSARADAVQYDQNTFFTIEWSDGKHSVKSPVAITWT